jgi:hypothetical protein
MKKSLQTLFYFYFCLMACCFLPITQARAQENNLVPKKFWRPVFTPYVPGLQLPDHSIGYTIPGKRASQYTAEDWGKVIDSTWGQGQGAAEQIQIFDTFWNLIDQRWSGFPNLPIKWDSLRTVYKAQIDSGLSRGRFLALMSRMWMALLEHHTYIIDNNVESIFGTPTYLNYKSGVPLLCINTGFLSLLGAAITPTPDSSGLVYRVTPGNPLGLVPGDLVLGYEGIPWKRLYQQMLDDGVPVSNAWSSPGSTPESRTHEVLSSVGWNWGMFDTIDVVKYSTGDTLHLSTAPLSTVEPTLWATDQVPIAGVPMPKGCYINSSGPAVSWGVVQGTNIGYVYVWDWDGELGYPGPTAQLFHDAIYDLLHNKNVDGLVLDFRTNWGGWFSSANGGLSQLFNFDPTSNMARATRNIPTNHMGFSSFEEVYQSKFTPGNDLFDRPIAVLIGPACLSMGDWNAFRMRFHPMARLFGKPTNGAFVGGNYLDGQVSDAWLYQIPTSIVYSNVPNEGYLIHKGVQPDEEVWLTRNGVAKGEDDVVKKALEWMNNLVYPHDIMTNKSCYASSGDTVHLSTTIENPNSHQISARTYLNTSEGVLIDSIDLSKQTINGTEENWLAKFNTPHSEEFYNISVKTFDQSSSTSFTRPNATRFTTAGPLIIDSISYNNQPTYKRCPIWLFLLNKGKTLSLTNVSLKITCSDPWVISIVSSNVDFPAIQPGAIVQANQYSFLYYDSTSPGYFNLKFEISIDGWTYWKDSVKFTPVTGIKDLELKPVEYSLSQNYPNPFNPSTIIKYGIKEKSNVKITIFNVIGKQVALVLNEEMQPGYHQADFNAANLPSGVYFYRIQAGSFVETKKMILLK